MTDHSDLSRWRSVHVVASQLGFMPGSVKRVSLVAGEASESSLLPDEIPFYVNPIPYRHLRDNGAPPSWRGDRYPWPFDIGIGTPIEGSSNYGETTALGRPRLFVGVLSRTRGRWGDVWVGDFSDFRESGLFQVETEYDYSSPFEISDDVLVALERGYLSFVRAQRSGHRQAGLRPAIHLDDAVLPDTGEYVPASGGWCDAGDARKWMSTTLGHLVSLSAVLEGGDPDFSDAAVEEIDWGNRYFHAMVSPEGQVYENVGGGALPEGYTVDTWWFDNHSGTAADGSGNAPTDNVPNSGDERVITTLYNANVQFAFARAQAVAARAGGPGTARCQGLAEKAWRYGRERGHDGRTLFLAAELLAGAELLATGSAFVTEDDVAALALRLMTRQVVNGDLTGFFVEEDGDGYRSIAFSCEPALALMKASQVLSANWSSLRTQMDDAIARYVDDYVVRDSQSNPFLIPPYGVFIPPPHPESQAFRDYGDGRGVRTFMAPFTRDQILHGTNSVVMQQALVLALQAERLGRADLAGHAEQLLQWGTGWNPTGLSLFTGIGCRVVTQFSAVVRQVPDASVTGFIGRADDTPYVEESRAVEWSTQEVWGPPFQAAVQAAIVLRRYRQSEAVGSRTRAATRFNEAAASSGRGGAR